MTRPIVYIAGPFRADTAWEIAQNVRAAEQWGLHVATWGAIPIIPHSMYHLYHGTLSDEFWVDATLAVLRSFALHSAHFAVLVLDHELGERWRHSVGTVGEVAETQRRDCKVFFLNQTAVLEQWIKERINQ